jgi:uncharacterized Ntn-hydrolase superfamily protein
MTYSILARDPRTGEIGVAVQSHWFAVGAAVPWAEAGVGAVVTQAMVDPAYGPLGLALMRAGRSAPEALRGLIASDANARLRQVAMIDAAGRAAAHTGERCVEAAGHLVGAAFSAQGNMMRSAAVWPAMAQAFERAPGDLAGRLLVALEAAELAGGDIRGQQSAALVVVAGAGTGRPWVDRHFDLRVDDHPRPLEELHRLVELARAYQHMDRGDLALEQRDRERALEEYAAAESRAPDNLEVRFWHGVALLNMGRSDEGHAVLSEVVESSRAWKELLARVQRAGLANNG